MMLGQLILLFSRLILHVLVFFFIGGEPMQKINWLWVVQFDILKLFRAYFMDFSKICLNEAW